MACPALSSPHPDKVPAPPGANPWPRREQAAHQTTPTKARRTLGASPRANGIKWLMEGPVYFRIALAWPAARRPPRGTKVGRIISPGPHDSFFTTCPSRIRASVWIEPSR